VLRREQDRFALILTINVGEAVDVGEAHALRM
jgi:hypothetical protein